MIKVLLLLKEAYSLACFRLVGELTYQLNWSVYIEPFAAIFRFGAQSIIDFDLEVKNVEIQKPLRIRLLNAEITIVNA